MKKIVSALLLATLAVTPSAWSKDRFLTVKPGTIAVAVLRVNGQPVGAADLELQSIEGKSILTAKTDEVGLTTIKIDQEGIYRLTVGGNVNLPLQVTSAAQQTTLKVVLPVEYKAGAPVIAALTAVGFNIGLGTAAALLTSVPPGVDDVTQNEFISGVLGYISADDFNKLSNSQKEALLREIGSHYVSP